MKLSDYVLPAAREKGTPRTAASYRGARRNDAKRHFHHFQRMERQAMKRA